MPRRVQVSTVSVASVEVTVTVQGPSPSSLRWVTTSTSRPETKPASVNSLSICDRVRNHLHSANGESSPGDSTPFRYGRSVSGHTSETVRVLPQEVDE